MPDHAARRGWSSRRLSTQSFGWRHARPAPAHDRADAALALSAVDILFLLIPFSVVLVFALMAVFAWALQTSQFDDLQREGARILGDDTDVDGNQAPS